MHFLFESLYSNYVPFIKFEDVIYIKGKPTLLKRRRKTIKNLVTQVIKSNQIKKKIIKISKKKEKIN